MNARRDIEVLFAAAFIAAPWTASAQLVKGAAPAAAFAAERGRLPAAIDQGRSKGGHPFSGNRRIAIQCAQCDLGGLGAQRLDFVKVEIEVQEVTLLSDTSGYMCI